MIEIAGRTFRIDSMTPREQFHVMRRLSPIVGSMGDSIYALLDESRPRDEVMKAMSASIGPLAEALAFLPDELVDYVLDTCLSYVKCMDTEAGTPIYLKQPRGQQAIRRYQDIDGMTELRLVAEVIKVNLSGFFGQLSGASASPLSAPGAAH